MRTAWMPLALGLLLSGCGATSATGSLAAQTPGSPPSSGSSPSATASPHADRITGWRADLDTLITAREDIHAHPWHGIARNEYVAAVRAVADRVPELTDNELLVEVTRLAAMPTWAGRDGHGGIYPWGEGTFGVHMYPIRLYLFSDGIFVVDALPPHGDLVGTRVDTIGGISVAEVAAAVEPLVPRDNQQQVLTHSPRLMLAAEILEGLHLIEDAAAPVTFTLSRDAEEVEVELAPIPVARYEGWTGGHHAHSPPARPDGPAWLRQPSETIWWELLPESRTAYIQYNLVAGVGSVSSEVEAAIDAGDVDRVVMDVRHNPGGNNTVYGRLLVFLERAAERLPGRVYVIMGRATFSAAGNFVTEVDRDADVVLVGEDLGTSPNQYGDSRAVPLEHSGLVFRVAPQYVTMSDPDDPRITISPDIPAPLSSADYFGDRDPAMEAILADGG